MDEANDRSGWVLLIALSLASATGCSCDRPHGHSIDANVPDAQAVDTGVVTIDTGPVDANRDANYPDVGLSPDAACASATSTATLTRLPADIIWIVDNSTSMMPAIDAVRTGINGFASQLVASSLDYRMIMLSLRSARTGRYPICVPQPLAGPACADGPNYFQIDVDIKSTKPIEQILGTLAQSAMYTSGAADGGGPWRQLLRPGATRTFVLVTDDNSRTCAMPGGSTCLASDPPLTATSLEDFPGGGDPFNASTLGPGLLDASYSGLFTGYTFDAIYGWGSATDPTVRCTYPGGAQPPSSGQTYTTLVQRTGGVRAHICDGAAAFGPFFDAIAASVVRGSAIACNVAIPTPPGGMVFQAGRVNVLLRGTSATSVVGHVNDTASCDATRGGWFYDVNAAPTQIILCPTSCMHAQSVVVGTGTGLDVQFGCESIPI